MRSTHVFETNKLNAHRFRAQMHTQKLLIFLFALTMHFCSAIARETDAAAEDATES